MHQVSAYDFFGLAVGDKIRLEEARQLLTTYIECLSKTATTLFMHMAHPENQVVFDDFFTNDAYTFVYNQHAFEKVNDLPAYIKKEFAQCSNGFGKYPLLAKWTDEIDQVSKGFLACVEFEDMEKTFPVFAQMHTGFDAFNRSAVDIFRKLPMISDSKVAVGYHINAQGHLAFGRPANSASSSADSASSSMLQIEDTLAPIAGEGQDVTKKFMDRALDCKGAPLPTSCPSQKHVLTMNSY